MTVFYSNCKNKWKNLLSGISIPYNTPDIKIVTSCKNEDFLVNGLSMSMEDFVWILILLENFEEPTLTDCERGRKPSVASGKKARIRAKLEKTRISCGKNSCCANLEKKAENPKMTTHIIRNNSRSQFFVSKGHRNCRAKSTRR